MLKIISLILCFVFAELGYAQEQLQWGVGGVPIIVAKGAQYGQLSVVTPNNDIFIAWTDNRNGDFEKFIYEDDIYIQKININGSKYLTSEGIPVIVKPGRQILSGMISDGSEGVILAWTDCVYNLVTNRLENGKVYVQHIDKDGNLLWGKDGVLVNDGTNEYFPILAQDGRGGAFIFWSRGFYGSLDSLRAQHVSSEGKILWATDGIQITDPTKPGYLFLRMVSDNKEGMICLVVYKKDYPSDADVVVQRLSFDGTKMWGEYGTGVVKTSSGTGTLALVADNDGGAIVCWGTVMAQKINASGALMWGSGKKIMSVPPDIKVDLDYGINKLVNDGTGNFILGKLLKQKDNTSPISFYLYAQRFSPDGVLMWNDGLKVTEILFSDIFGNDNMEFAISNDTFGGLFVAWDDGKDIETLRPYVQHINKIGEKLWGNGTLLIDDTFPIYPSNITLTNDNQGGAIALWSDGRNKTNGDIYAQRVYQNQRPKALEIKINPSSANENENISFAGKGDDFDGKVVAYNWRSSIDDFLSNEAEFSRDNLSCGRHTIYFKVQDDKGDWSEEIFAPLNINAKPTALIDSITPNPAVYGTEVALKGHGEDRDGSVVDYNWRSDKDGYLGNSSLLTTSKLSAGQHNIFFKVKDDNGVWSTEVSKQLTIQQVPAENGIISGTAFEFKKVKWGIFYLLKKMPLEGVTITATCKQIKTVNSVVSDIQGKFSLKNLPKGLYEITVTKDGYFPFKTFAYLIKNGQFKLQKIMIKKNRDL